MVLFKALDLLPTGLTPTGAAFGTVAVGIVLLLLRIVYLLFFSPLKDIPGPSLARFTRLWELRQMIRGDSHETITKLHEQHGKANLFMLIFCLSDNHQDR